MRTTQGSTAPRPPWCAAPGQGCTSSRVPSGAIEARLRLSPLDRQILAQILIGETDEAIAARCETSTRTVRRRMARLSTMLSARSRAALAAIVVQLGIVQIDVSSVFDGLSW